MLMARAAGLSPDRRGPLDVRSELAGGMVLRIERSVGTSADVDSPNGAAGQPD